MKHTFSRTGGYRAKIDWSVRSGFEGRVKKNLDKAGIGYEYEKDRIPYTSSHYYKPDFTLSNGVIVEAKGLFLPEDRKKHLLIQKQHPELDVRFLFQRDQKISKTSKTKYSDWCNKHNFKYHIGEHIPKEWSE